MARLIDAEKLWLTTEYTEDGKVHKYYEQFEVDEAPTIDAEPVRHGKWEVKNECGYEDMTCSVCRRVCKDYGWFADEWNFCPNCGAKMDEVNDE